MFASLPSFSRSTLAITPQAPLLGTFNTLTNNVWTSKSYSYTAAASKVYNLTFQFETNKKDSWYIDDVSVRNTASVELLTNGNFESGALSPEWIPNIVGGCASQTSVSTAEYHSSNHAFYDTCEGPGVAISQFFNGTAGASYTVDFWYYHAYGGSGGGSYSVEMNVYIT